ncbi:ABC transporter transmembrane domain-containing protein [Chitinimonas sp. BJB300]|uniref:ABC transporter transmembrane domain-containing protein n=1 Tax=Chitinimonas sp. BJB300 TaxID=1559339 RepID=UPI000C0D6932|nr:ABC transporter transmembrane domain-containing protein [Chitinimonas sp. BJB300]PHV11192.1 ABC transporter [Chitinimonas sp. BJB300]TSJ89029.1 ATP-binding cassette domain-containing protein [Chitinimonas sp. BJB300]
MPPVVLIRSLLAPYKTRIVIAAIALVIAAGCMLLVGQGLRAVIDKGFVASDPTLIDQALLALFGLIAVMATATYARFYFVSWLGERVTADLRRKVFDHLLTLPPSFFESGRTGEVISRLTNDTTQIETVIGSSASMALRNALMLVGGLVMLAVTSLKLTLLVLVCVPLVVAPILLFGRRVRKLSRQSQDKVAAVSSVIDETVHEIRTVQAYGHEPSDRAAFADRVEATFATGKQRIRQRAMMIVAVMVLVFGAVAAILWVGGHDVLAGKISAGQLSAFVFYAVIVAGAVATISEVIGEVQRAAGALERLLELLSTHPGVANPSVPKALPLPPRGEISFDAVQFHYPTRPEQAALADFTLTVAPGEKVALVGPSGAGKSTVFQLLLRFYDPANGTVRVDGMDLRDVSIDTLRSRIAIVSQEAVIFAMSVLDNVRYGRPDASEAEVKTACDAAFASEFIEQLPEGYQTDLGERGVRLSGGQRQRIAIARAILADRPILLLDEATSALDSHSERMVQQALDRLMQGRTTLIIAHRLSTVLHADRIVLVDAGRIGGVGRHTELLASNPLYHRLAQLQLQA